MGPPLGVERGVSEEEVEEDEEVEEQTWALKLRLSWPPAGGASQPAVECSDTFASR